MKYLLEIKKVTEFMNITDEVVYSEIVSSDAEKIKRTEALEAKYHHLCFTLIRTPLTFDQLIEYADRLSYSTKEFTIIKERF